MSRICADHLAREAVVYVRQSTAGQLRHNPESRRRQYGLRERARSLGWREPVVIDEDLGRSGGGTSRPGFERLLVAICEGRVGMVLSLEASRLARNGRDWHTLLEFCALVGCLLGDEDGVYDPRQPNDRLLLGMKGTLSEMELSTLRQRSEAALRRVSSARGDGRTLRHGKRGFQRPCGSVHARDGLGLRMASPTTDGSITRVEVFDYRCLRRVSQRLRPFQVLVGPNGSGKSSFIDAIAFVCDLQQTSVEGAVYGDHRVGVPMRAPDARHLTWMREGERFGLVVEARIPDALRDGIEDERLDTFRYECVIDTKGPPVLVIESLWLRAEQATYENDEQGRTCVAGWPPLCEPAIEPEPIGTVPRAMTRLMSVVPSGSSSKHHPHDPSHGPPRFVRQSRRGKRTSLSDYALESPYPDAVAWFSDLMAPLQRISLSGEALRRPSPPSTVAGIGPDGGNLANLIHNFKKEDTERFRLWIRHVREALPEIEDIRTHERPEDHHRYLVVHYRNGLKAPSWIVSEGTLRLLALTSLAYAPLPPGPCVIEEPENGIHPTAVETVIQSLSSAYGRQVLLATHSPLIATLADARDVLCFGHSDETGTTVVCGHEHPRLENWQGRADLGTLLASGVL